MLDRSKISVDLVAQQPSAVQNLKPLDDRGPQAPSPAKFFMTTFFVNTFLWSRIFSTTPG